MIFELGHFVLDSQRLELRCGAERLAVQPKVLRLLVELVSASDRPVSNDELLRSVWPDETVTISSIKRAVRAARIALGDSGSSQSIIRTVRGCGYQFLYPAPPVRSRDWASSPARGWSRCSTDRKTEADQCFIHEVAHAKPA